MMVKGLGATLDNQPWYCNGSYLSGWLGCDKFLPSAADQQTMMYSNFGPGVPQQVQDVAVTDYGTWLSSVGYDQQLSMLESDSGSNIWMYAAIGLGAVLLLRR